MMRRCGRCLQPRELKPGAHYCDPCRELANQRNAALKSSQKKGVCRDCGGTTSWERYERCAECQVKHARQLRRQIRDERVAAGLPVTLEPSTGADCTLCAGLPWRVSGRRCRECGTRRGEEQMPPIEWYASQKIYIDIRSRTDSPDRSKS